MVKIAAKKSEPVVEVATVEGNAYVPDKSVGDRYISRKIGKHYDVELLDYALDNKKNVLLMGDTGAGKTMLGEAYASKVELPYYSLPCDVSVDPSALFGKIVPTEEGSFEWVDGPVTELVRYGGVLNISEINFMPPRISAALYPLLDSRRYLPLLGHRGEIVEAHDELLIIADMNPQYRGTQDLNAAFKNRFAIKIPWGYDKVVESELIANAKLLEFAYKLRDTTELRTPVATNMLMEFVEFESALGFDFAAYNFLASFDSSEVEAVKNVMKLFTGDIKSAFDAARATTAKKTMMDSAEEEDPFLDGSEEFTYEQGGF